MAEDMHLGVLAESFADMLGGEWPRERAIGWARDGGGEFAADLWEAMARLGWTALTVPDAHGGLGLGLDAAAVLQGALGQVVAPAPMLGTLLAAQLLAGAGSEAQQAAWLPGIADGSVRVAFAPVDDAALVADGGAVSGEVDDLLDAPAATHLLVRAVRGGAPGWLMLAVDAAGVTVEPIALFDTTRMVGKVMLRDVACDGAAFIAASTEVCDRLVRAAQLAIAADSQGAGEATLALTIEYMKGRVQFGKPIGSFQALKHRVADHQSRLVGSRHLLDHAAGLAADDPEALLMALSARELATRVAGEVARDCIQLHGGVGFTAEYAPHLYLKRAKLNECLWGSRAATLDRIAGLLEAA